MTHIRNRWRKPFAVVLKHGVPETSQVRTWLRKVNKRLNQPSTVAQIERALVDQALYGFIQSQPRDMPVTGNELLARAANENWERLADAFQSPEVP